MVKYVIIWLLVLAMITGSLTHFFGPIALLYVVAALVLSGAIVWLLQ
jgi:membrane protein YdbS with pleckstrin-like domain